MSIQQPALKNSDLPHGHPAPPMRMTEEEFLARADEEVKAEWVDGEVIVMAPASDWHVDLNDWLVAMLRMFVEHHDLGIVRGSELPVRLSGGRRRVPDVLFLSKARLQMLRQNHIEGAPDLIMEIVSPESESRDRREKYLDYQAGGVQEYWVIDRITQNMELYVLSDTGEYRQVPEIDGKLHSTVLEGLFLRPEWIWQEKLPKLIETLKLLRVIV